MVSGRKGIDLTDRHGEERTFLKGRYGFDAVCAVLVLLTVLIDLLLLLLPYEEIRRFGFISFVPMALCVLRMLSRDRDRREMENDILVSAAGPFGRALERRRERKYQKKTFRFFVCPGCRQQLRVPRGKGRVEITCPSCGDKFIRKA